MFVKQTLSLFALLAGGSLLLAGCDAAQEPWTEYTGFETESEGKNTFYHRRSGDKMCFVGRMTHKSKSLSGTYAGYYNSEAAKLHFYGWIPQLKVRAGSAGLEATDIKVASINQPEDPAALANLIMAENSPLDDKGSEAFALTSISNVFTEHSCWNGGKGLPKSLAGTLKEKF